MKKVIKILAYPFLFKLSLIWFMLTKKTSNQGFASFRFLFVFTNGGINNFISDVISFFIPKYKIDKTKGVLGEMTNDKVSQVVNEIKENGYYIFEERLENEVINKLVHFAKNTEASFLEFESKYIKYSSNKVLFDEENIISPRYQFNSKQLLKSDIVPKIAFDKGLLAIANQYLNTKPILDIVTMWWSAPFNLKGQDKAAQMYHFDMDRLKFLKFFFYLNDVHENNGPHCYIAKSHKKLPKQILADRRIKDEEIVDFYPAEDIKEIIGEKGTIIAVDTRGLHKGKPLTDDKRLLFQLQFSNSLFGASYDKVEGVQLDDTYIESKRKYKRSYQLFNN